MSNFEKSNFPKSSLLLIDTLNSLFDCSAIKNLLNSCQKWYSNHSNIGELRTGNRILKKKSVGHHYLHTRCNLEIPVNPEVATCLEKQIKNQTYKTWQLITLHLNPLAKLIATFQLNVFLHILQCWYELQYYDYIPCLG